MHFNLGVRQEQLALRYRQQNFGRQIGRDARIGRPKQCEPVEQTKGTSLPLGQDMKSSIVFLLNEF
jgi:hypothetical protein